MDYVPLLLLGLVVVGGAIVLRSMIRLKRAAVEALEAARQLDDQLASLRNQTQGPQTQGPQTQGPQTQGSQTQGDDPDPPGDDPPPGDRPAGTGG
ncbi:MAG: hypothetical protein H0X58_06360 [Acidimicrobiia bacterium]|nr:hypothetical protein [Acidimicrobiia bacterium]